MFQVGQNLSLFRHGLLEKEHWAMGPVKEHLWVPLVPKGKALHGELATSQLLGQATYESLPVSEVNSVSLL